MDTIDVDTVATARMQRALEKAGYAAVMAYREWKDPDGWHPDHDTAEAGDYRELVQVKADVRDLVGHAGEILKRLLAAGAGQAIHGTATPLALQDLGQPLLRFPRDGREDLVFRSCVVQLFYSMVQP